MIETARLVIRPFQAADATDLHEYLSIPVTYRFEPGRPVSLEEARQLALERARGNDFWAVVLKNTGKLIGHLYFAHIDPQETMTWELGYIFNPAFQNQGFATEASAALIRHGFAHFGIHRVIACCNPDNPASWKVLEKIGMRREAAFRKNIFFHRDEHGNPLWTDTFVYALLPEDLEPCQPSHS